MMQNKKDSAAERRRYLRLDSVFPVEFRILSLDGKTLLSDWLQGFTSDISKGGICLEINNLKPDLAKKIQSGEVKLSLGIEMPLRGAAIRAVARIAWFKEIAGEPTKHLVGLSYEDIMPRDAKRILQIARTKKLFAPVALSVIGLLAAAFLFGTYLNVTLIKKNKALVGQLIQVAGESSSAKQQVKDINREKENLQLQMQSLKTQMETIEQEQKKLGEQVETEEKDTGKRAEEIKGISAKISKETTELKEKLSEVQSKESVITQELLRLHEKRMVLEKANLEKMYQWLKVHQNPRTGLVLSFEGDKDLTDWGFTYDQALAAIAFTHFSDFSRAKKIFDFFTFKARRINSLFVNAYYVNDGSPAEFVVHNGPNIWMGIAILQYTKKSHDRSYLRVAEEIGRCAMIMQKQGKGGGICGGPDLNWYSTEHNLDAYALFSMLYAVTGKEAYLQSRDKILSWLVTHTYDKSGIPVKRGMGDATIATDTYAWSIAAVGPEKLQESGLDPDKIMDFAEKNCGVEVDFVRPDGQIVKIKGFDFAPQAHLGRGGVVSTEWTAQMVLAFDIMADFYYKKGLTEKARNYELKADEYLSSLSNMIISSPSPSGQGASCLPYASQDFVDTGHGWITPKGKSTGSVAGTVYTLFAYYKFNPLELK